MVKNDRQIRHSRRHRRVTVSNTGVPVQSLVNDLPVPEVLQVGLALRQPDSGAHLHLVRMPVQ